MPTLPPEWIELLSAGPSHRVGSCSAEGRPGIGRALAAESLPDGRLRVLMARDAGPDVLDAIQATGQVAVVMALPTSHRTLHVKGRDAQVALAEPEDFALLPLRFKAFVEQLRPFGFSEEAIADNWYRVLEGGLYRISFTISGAWNQTPGPGAGQPLELLT